MPFRLLYVVTEDWYFLSHRLPMARAARDAGYEVHVATNLTDDATAIASEGFSVHPVPFVRGALSPAAALRSISALRAIHAKVAPSVCHHVSVQAAVLGSLAAIGRPTVCVNALTGFGYVFTSKSAKASLVRPWIRALLRRLLIRHTALIQNPDDREDLIAFGIPPDRIELIPGSGVDVDHFSQQPGPDGQLTVAFAGRLLEDKGIRTLVDAHRRLRSQGVEIRLLIAGAPDAANPASVTESEASSWNSEPGIQWLGQVQDIGELWARAHIAVLPSRREGFPKSLLEAAACGRPMIASDVPGCREIVRPGETGILVPPDNAAALAEAIKQLAESPALRAQFGSAARRLVVENFSSAIIGARTTNLYNRLLEQSGLTAGPAN